MYYSFDVFNLIGPRNLAGHTLALMWILILHYHFGITSSGGSGEQGISSAKKLLLGWIQAALPDRNIANLNTNWSDGHNLVALVNRMKPGLIANTWNSPLERVTEAMKVAFEVFGIPQVFVLIAKFNYAPITYTDHTTRRYLRRPS